MHFLGIYSIHILFFIFFVFARAHTRAHLQNVMKLYIWYFNKRLPCYRFGYKNEKNFGMISIGRKRSRVQLKMIIRFYLLHRATRVK